MGRFFIDSIPDSAEYIPNDDFRGALDKWSNEVMCLDTRLTHSEARSLNPDPLYANFFEIEDRLCGQRKTQVLLSLSLYNINPASSVSGKRFDVYLDGLKQWIAYMKSKYGQHESLRVYVGNDCWDILHREGVFENTDFDFIRMRATSKYTYTGTWWRYLAFDDYDYDYVYIDETDGHGYMMDGNWVIDGQIRGRPIQSFEKLPSDIHFSTSILRPPRDALAGVYTAKRDLSYYMRLVTPHLVRCKSQLPFAMKDLLSWHLSHFSDTLLYLPTQNLWSRFVRGSNIRHARDGHFLFPISAITKSILRLACDSYEKLNQLSLIHTANWFYKRLYDDLRSDGNTIVAYAEYDKGYPFDKPISL